MVGGALNAVAGGGTFAVLPALLVVGVPPVVANATATAVLWPAGMVSLVAYRPHLGDVRGWIWLAGPSLGGGLLGAWLLLGTADADFVQLMPWLLLAATCLFALGPRLARRMGQSDARGAATVTPLARATVGVSQAAIGVYGGYFGGGMGIVMLALYSLTGVRSIHSLNGLKSLQIVCINGVAVAAYAASGAIDGSAAAIMAGGSVVGAWLGARAAQRVDVTKVRRFIVAAAVVLTGWLFWRASGAA